MQLILFIKQTISFSFLFFCLFHSSSIDVMVKHQNFLNYQKNLLLLLKDAAGFIALIFSLFNLSLFSDYYPNNILRWGLIIISIPCGYFVYKFLLSKIKMYITYKRNAYIPDCYLEFWDALASIGVSKEYVSNYETLPLAHGDLTTLTYKGHKLYCESYKDGIVHSIYYYEPDTYKSDSNRNFLFWDCMSHTDISYWKELK